MSSSVQPLPLGNLCEREDSPASSTNIRPESAFVSNDGPDKPLLSAFEEETEQDRDHDSLPGVVTPRSWLRRPFKDNSSSTLTRLALAGGLFLLGLAAYSVFATSDSDVVRQQIPGPYWHGFGNISNIFAFGDSWTTTHFDVHSQQPSPLNPIGNPEFPGWTSSNGWNYVGYLAAKYNQTPINVYDFAFGGSVIDTHYDLALLDWLDLPHQIKDEFQQYYVKNGTDGAQEPIGWNSEDSLFSAFFGINDVMVYDRSGHYLKQLFASYERFIADLYRMSARNFLIINIPAVDMSPAGTGARTQGKHGRMSEDIKAFNRLIRVLIKHLRSQFPDITIFEYDVHDLSTRVIADPNSVLETVSYQNTTGYCKEYEKFEKGQVATEEQVQLCGLQVEEYLWLNTLHVTPPFHEAMAAEIERILTNPA